MAFMIEIALGGLLLSLFLIFSSLREYARFIQSACISAAFIYSQLYTSFGKFPCVELSLDVWVRVRVGTQDSSCLTLHLTLSSI